MDFGLSDEQILLQDSLARMLAECAPLARVRAYAEGDEARADDVWTALCELGVPGLVIAEQHGGSGLGLLDAALVAEMLGRHVAPVPFIASCVVVPGAIARAGSTQQAAAWLPRLAAGDVVAGCAVAEHTGAREDARVELRDGRLHGRALFVQDFAADLYLVASHDGRLHLVTADAPGLSRTPLVTIDRTRRVGELHFDDVPADTLPHGGTATLSALIAQARVLTAADTLGAAQAMLEQAVTYAGQRKQFGRVIASFQAVKHLCAEMAAELEPSRALLWYAAYAQDALPAEAAIVACHVKGQLAEVGTFVARTATEVHGGMGFTDLLGLHYWFKRIGANRQWYGSPERVREEAARLQGFAD